MLLEQLAAELKTKAVVTEPPKEPTPAAETAPLTKTFLEALLAPAAAAGRQAAAFNKAKMAEAPRTRTENGAVTFAGSGNPLFDFFFQASPSSCTQVVRTSRPEDIDDLLDRAWEHAPLETLQLVAHLRDVREGKGEKRCGSDAYIWLAHYHPRTLIVNLPEVVKVGFWKDLLQLLQRLCVGEDDWNEAARQKSLLKVRKGANREERRAGKLQRLRERKAALESYARGAQPQTASARRVEQPGGRRLASTRKAFRAPAAARGVRKGKWQIMSRGKAAGNKKGPKIALDPVKEATFRQHQANYFAGQLTADMKQAAEARHNKALAAKQRVRRKLKQDRKFCVLYAAVALTFAEQLRQDLANLQAGRQVSSLCAKWAPTPKQAHDNQTLIATAIAELLYPAEHFRRPGMSACDYTELARRSYAKEYLEPLREAACLPEVKMAQSKWGEIDYERVASVCMNINKGLFTKHDKERFLEYLEQVKKGEKKIASGALQPHELVEEAMGKVKLFYSFLGRCPHVDSSDSEEQPDAAEAVMEAQWKSYVDKLRQSGQLSSCLAVADASGSMYGEPMNVAIALSLLTAAVAKPPFNQLICTFSATPELHLVKGDTLVKQVQDVSRMKWGMNTNVNAIFDLILKKAVATRLKPEDMVSTIFIFSDMEFDQADEKAANPLGAIVSSRVPSKGFTVSRRPKSNFESIKAKFEAAGYKLPQVVFWNLRASDIRGQKSTPVKLNEEGVALVSGFSGHLLKLFMDQPNDLTAWEEELSPETLMTKAIKGKGHYNSWRVVD
ncbi:g10789 [Coccomyxa viridis]|uniref:G10789 protein n=1 Tax=Coccomyxa viridis TaxID=1274662 RepID=A0ABP1GB17_9CHLO